MLRYPWAPVPEDVLLEVLGRELGAAGLDPLSWVLVSARLAPSLLLIPAFGLAWSPLPLRLLYALALAAAVAPVLPAPAPSSAPLLAAIGAEVGRGLPAAVSVTAALWGASMAGNLLDELRRGPARTLGVGSEPLSPLGVLLSLGAAVAFFELSGPARLVDALATAPPLGVSEIRALAELLARSIRFAVVLAGPLLAVLPLLELAHALLARAARPVAPGALLAPLRSLLLLALCALLIEQIASGAVAWLDRALPPS